MNLEQELKIIAKRIQKLKSQFQNQAHKVSELEKKNIQLKEENDELKKINFEQKKQIEIADIANQLSEQGSGSGKLKKEISKYIREVDAVIAALKKME